MYLTCRVTFKYHQSDGEGSIFLRHEFRHGFFGDRWELMVPFLLSDCFFQCYEFFILLPEFLGGSRSRIQ